MTSNHSDNEIDDIIWSEISLSESKGDFICYVIHSLIKAKFLEQAKQKIETLSDNSLSPDKYFNAIEKIEALANQQHPVAAFHMGKINALGIAVPQNLPEGIRWYEKAITLGEPRAYANLGWLYQSGYGVLVDTAKAFELLSYASEHGVLSAKAAVGMMLLKGENGTPAPTAGVRKLEEAFDAGYLNAGNVLSDLYFEGRHVRKNIELAHLWLEKVALRGDGRSMAILGHYLVTGSHGKQNIENGLKWMYLAIDAQFLPAYLWLGTLYKTGNGVEKDIDKAFDLFRKGVQAGYKDCGKAISILLAELNHSEQDAPKQIH